MAPATAAPILQLTKFTIPTKSKPSQPPLLIKNSFSNSCSDVASYSSANPSDFIRLHLFSKCCTPHAHVTRVSTVPVGQVSAAPELEIEEEVTRLTVLRESLASCWNVEEKLIILDSDHMVSSFFRLRGNFFKGVDLSNYEVYLLKCMISAGQQHVFGEFWGDLDGVQVDSGSAIKSALYALASMIENWDSKDVNGGGYFNAEDKAALEVLLRILGDMERFYDCIGGIIGYQIMVLKLLSESTAEGKTTNGQVKTMESVKCELLEIHPPSVVNLAEDTEYASQAALWGIEGLPELAEIYPLGGSADRLSLVDPDTGECLPAAVLPYCGRSLLEGLIRDLQAREFLYFKLFGKQCITPVAIMTSSAKKNHEHISSLCIKSRWFGRGQSNFKLFEQPLVPAVSTKDGRWIVSRPLAPVCKPGGHGVIWKLAHDKGVFKWLRSQGRKGATVRQISNVVAATDLTLMALAGIGLRNGKKLGFASCKRSFGATEGINVLLEKRLLDGKWSYGLTCIEYTEFDKFGIVGQQPLSANRSLQADFPANTNILYVDLPSAELVASSNSAACLPGMVLNKKKTIAYIDEFGITHSVSGGRLECTMQNIADNFSNTFSSRCYEGVEAADGLDTFIVYNKRRKVTSSAKRKPKHGSTSLHQTPNGSLLDIIRNAYDLLSQCGISIPKVGGNEEYIDSAPPYLILLHPALGPLWEVTRHKFTGGAIAGGSELQIEVAEFLWRNVELDGSLIILAENAVGSMQINEKGEPVIHYGNRCGRCRLENVKVMNAGVDWKCGDNVYWKHDVKRFEGLKVILHGNAEFEATDVTFHGNYVFTVPDGHRLRITPGASGFETQLKPIEEEAMERGTWRWNYRTRGSHIELELVEERVLVYS